MFHHDDNEKIICADIVQVQNGVSIENSVASVPENSIGVESAATMNNASSTSTQILLDRFSSWRKLANENANALLEKTKKSSSKWNLSVGRQTLTDTFSAEGGEFTEEVSNVSNESLSSEDDSFSPGSRNEDSDDDENLLLPGQVVPLPPSVPPTERILKASVEPLEQRVANAAGAVKAAASVVADSVATGFRGRYSGRSMVEAIQARKSKPVRPRPIESQTAQILKSRAASHVQSILDNLESHEYFMLLGVGMFGVNLKQTYLKGNGVYIDYLVPDGAAEMSNVVYVGDLLVKVGEVDVRKGTIITVPKTIAGAKRPVILVLSTGTKIAADYISYIDIAVAMMHRIRHGQVAIAGVENHHFVDLKPENTVPAETAGCCDVAMSQSTAVTSPLENSDIQCYQDDKKEMTHWSTRPQSEIRACSINKSSRSSDYVHIPFPVAVESIISPVSPPKQLQELFLPDVARRYRIMLDLCRCNETFSAFLVRQAVSNDDGFLACLHNAFVTCTVDDRRLPFFARYLSSVEVGADGVTQSLTLTSTPGSALLMLFLEMLSYVDLHEITPSHRRREIANRIANYFLPARVGPGVESPSFDCHHIVPDSCLRRLEHVINAHAEDLSRDIFLDFQVAIIDIFSKQQFLLFLMSNECARMGSYLRNTAPFVNVPLGWIFDAVVSSRWTRDKMDKDSVASAKNHFSYMLVHLLCQSDVNTGVADDESNRDSGNIMEAASCLCCAVFIRRDLASIVDHAKGTCSGSSDAHTAIVFQHVIDEFRRFWEIFLFPARKASPSVLPDSNNSNVVLTRVRSLVWDVLEGVSSSSTDEQIVVAGERLSFEIFSEADRLADELLYDYAKNHLSAYREHKLHEWMCSELCEIRASHPLTKYEDYRLPVGCIKRFLRNLELPSRISSHKPIRYAQAAVSNQRNRCYPNSEYGVVFGTSVEDNNASQAPNFAINKANIQRFACQNIAPDSESDGEQFDASRVPLTLESYAVFPRAARSPPCVDLRSDIFVSRDGWEVTLVNFVMPRADSPTERSHFSTLFAVSLVLQKIENRIVGPTSSLYGNRDSSAMLVKLNETCASIPVFHRHLRDQPWSERNGAIQTSTDCAQREVIGVALVSDMNVIPAMRDVLLNFFFHYCQEVQSGLSGEVVSFKCDSLVSLLGNFAHTDIEPFALKIILEPHLRSSSEPWIDKPLLEQKSIFESVAGQQLLSCLCPIPLALLIVTALLEQKVVLASSRRSMLLYASTALSCLIEPLKWCHLLVPLVPSTLGRDLLQYPAPFIIGLPSEDPPNIELLNNLPSDVTLVDLDVGRVILASSFSENSETPRGDGSDKESSATLRSQVLCLAEALGRFIGARLHGPMWHCDSPISRLSGTIAVSKDFDAVRIVCRTFLTELLEGTAACCYWIEEATAFHNNGNEGNPSVLFDEDRFLYIKNLRSQCQVETLFPTLTSRDAELALSLDGFDLLLATFLRCQCMSSFISSIPKSKMAYF